MSLCAALPQEELSRDAGGRGGGRASTGRVSEPASVGVKGNCWISSIIFPKVTEDTVGRGSEEDKRRVRCLVSSSQWSQFPSWSFNSTHRGLSWGGPAVSLSVSHISSHQEAPGRVTRGVGHGCDSETLWGCAHGKLVGVLVELATVGKRKWSKAPETGRQGKSEETHRRDLMWHLRVFLLYLQCRAQQAFSNY